MRDIIVGAAYVGVIACALSAAVVMAAGGDVRWLVGGALACLALALVLSKGASRG